MNHKRIHARQIIKKLSIIVLIFSCVAGVFGNVNNRALSKSVKIFKIQIEKGKTYRIKPVDNVKLQGHTIGECLSLEMNYDYESEVRGDILYCYSIRSIGLYFDRNINLETPMPTQAPKINNAFE